MTVDDFERGQQPLARLAVEALDALAQRLDGLHQIVALGGQRGVLGFDLAQLFLGAQIDRTEPLAIPPQLFEILLDLGKRRQLLARLDLGEPGHGLRFDFEHVVDFALDIGKAALGAVHALFGAGACASARTCAALWRCPSMSLRTAASFVSVSRLGGNSASAAVAFSCAPSASVLSAVRRLRASVSADFRAACRLISRSVEVWR